MPITFHHHRFPNGLTLIAETNPAAHTGAVGFFVKTGTRDEERAVMGVSHFLEHMVFKGTARRSAEDVNREFDEIGANYNAYTSQETTVYYAQVLPVPHVDSTAVPPDAQRVITLTTCHPQFSDRERMIIHGVLTQSYAKAPGFLPPELGEA